MLQYNLLFFLFSSLLAFLLPISLFTFFFNQPFPLTIAIYFLYGLTYYVHSERYVKILTCGMHGCDLIWK